MTASEDDDIVMRAVEERVKQWKVSLTNKIRNFHVFL